MKRQYENEENQGIGSSSRQDTHATQDHDLTGVPFSPIKDQQAVAVPNTPNTEEKPHKKRSRTMQLELVNVTLNNLLDILKSMAKNKDAQTTQEERAPAVHPIRQPKPLPRAPHSTHRILRSQLAPPKSPRTPESVKVIWFDPEAKRKQDLLMFKARHNGMSPPEHLLPPRAVSPYIMDEENMDSPEEREMEEPNQGNSSVKRGLNFDELELEFELDEAIHYPSPISLGSASLLDLMAVAPQASGSMPSIPSPAQWLNASESSLKRAKIASPDSEKQAQMSEPSLIQQLETISSRHEDVVKHELSRLVASRSQVHEYAMSALNDIIELAEATLDNLNALLEPLAALSSNAENQDETQAVILETHKAISEDIATTRNHLQHCCAEKERYQAQMNTFDTFFLVSDEDVISEREIVEALNILIKPAFEMTVRDHALELREMMRIAEQFISGFSTAPIGIQDFTKKRELVKDLKEVFGSTQRPVPSC